MWRESVRIFIVGGECSLILVMMAQKVQQRVEKFGAMPLLMSCLIGFCALTSQWKLYKCPFMFNRTAFFKVIVTILSLTEHPTLFLLQRNSFVPITRIKNVKFSTYRIFIKLQDFKFL